MAHEADRPESERMVIGQHTLGVKRCRDRDLEGFGEPAHRIGRAASRGSVADQHNRIARRTQDLGGPLHLGELTDHPDAGH